MVTLTKTVQIRVDTEDPALAATIQAFSEGMNHVSSVIYAFGRPKSSMLVLPIVYHDLRETNGLKLQMA
jgi:hypothetical protein